METSRSSRERERERERARERECSSGECRKGRAAAAAANTADMDLHCECSEPPPAEQPPGRINRAAFKLFGKRRSGSAVPSIFGVKNKGEGKSSGKTGLVRSKTHDGLAETVVEGVRKEESSSSDQLSCTVPVRSEPGPGVAAGSSVTKSLSFFSLLKKNGRSEGSAEHRTGSKQRKGLKGLFSSMRWHRRDKSGREDREEAVLEAQPPAPPAPQRPDATEPQTQVLPIAACNKPQPPALAPEAVQDAPAETSPQETAGQPAVAREGGRPLTAIQNGESSPRQPESRPGPSPQLEQGFSTAGAPAPSREEAATGQLRPVTPLLQHKCKHSRPEAAPFSTAPSMTVTPPPEASAADPPSEPSMDRICSLFADVTSLKSFDSLTGCGDIIADPEEEAGSAGSSGTGSSGGGAAGGGGAGAAVVAGASVAAGVVCITGAAGGGGAGAAVTAVTAVTGAGAVRGGGGGGLILEKALPAPVRARLAPRKAQGGGVVAYQGGGEEMASPDEVDEADLQGFWEMLPQTETEGPPHQQPRKEAPATLQQPRAEAPTTRQQPRVEVPAIPQPPKPSYSPPQASQPPQPHHRARMERCGAPAVKALGLSKIPVSGGSSRAGKSHKEPEESRDKEAQDGVPNSDEGYWDSTTPGPEEESSRGSFLAKESLPRDSCSGDALYDLYVDPDESLAGRGSDEDMSSLSACEPKLTPPLQATFRSLKGSASLPRDSKIPVSVKQVPSHSASHGALVPCHAPAGHTPPAKAELPRTKIPVPRALGKRTGNKTVGGKLSHHEHIRK
ncbi:APC membrane recruitment protein 2 [Amia ocellicauda]|uniref:APC membrane recruitment protein 2 n=1 Tax=Amia ocellicauda TaxID=2972642 RepID=UPI003464121E